MRVLCYTINIHEEKENFNCNENLTVGSMASPSLYSCMS